jgi:hypothetical protein
MKTLKPVRVAIIAGIFTVVAFTCISLRAGSTPPAVFQAGDLPATELIPAQELAKILNRPEGEKPLIIQVGSHVLYEEAHIPRSEYIGPASSTAGISKLRERVSSLSHKQFIVIYCGCCPWEHCPNVKPASDLLKAMGFTNVRVLYLPDNFGVSWVDKGYPTERGQ